MAADTAVSVGVVISGTVLMFTNLHWIDPVISLVIAVVIFLGTWQLLKESVNLAVDAVPKGIDPATVRKHLERLPGVQSAHHLHIWALSIIENALTVHLVKPDPEGDDEADRKSTRLNSSHVRISYAVFCLKKKN